MKALKLKGTWLELAECDKPTIDNQSDLLVKVMRAGICGTDLHILEGIFSADQGLTLGHELVGQVETVGSAVTEFKAGDLVVVNPHGHCGDCFYCKRNCPHFCTKKSLDASIGMHRNGAFAPYCVVPAENCYILPEGVTFEQAVLVEPYSCIMHAIDQGAPIEEDMDILVLGAGIIGILATLILSHKKVRNVTVVELNEHRRETVKKMNLKGVRVVHPKEIGEEITANKADPTYGFDRSFDFTGAVPAIQLGFDCLRKRGKLVLFGVMRDGAECKFHLHDILYKEIKVTGALTNPGSLVPALEAIKALSAEGMLDLKLLDIREYALEDFNEVFTLLKKGEIAKGMFDLTQHH
jgi:L-iditol 2-dehydrogenase